MASSLFLSPPSYFPCCHRTKLNKKEHHLLVRYQLPRLEASRRISNYSQDGKESLVGDLRNWRAGSIGDFNFDVGNEDDEDDDDDEDEDRSVDLLVRFVQNVFRKISRRARKAVRAVLPISISTKLVGFSVNGVIILAFLWVLKAFLEV
ncbi:hypothetical protein BVC80_1185g12 [Macleaya cordata]|uniref:Uncharacterized protein n=1 Tax=Macleaya cordata TaxID=56857 RepID=A0A200PQ00_MACCD|nr:hypothetical protein BVC80_1185g12 [Macleaya cordata]